MFGTATASMVAVITLLGLMLLGIAELVRQEIQIRKLTRRPRKHKDAA